MKSVVDLGYLLEDEPQIKVKLERIAMLTKDHGDL